MSEPDHSEVALLNAALELPPDQRAAYLDQACAGDAAMHKQIEALLQAHDQAEDFLNAPPTGLKPGRTVLIGDSPVKKPGDCFGDYELLEEIARGGMGVVYKARQKSLDRQVAVKMLLFGPHASPALIRRFKVEAVAAGSLQHPNIVAIHEVGVREGQQFLVMDYVDGPDLGTLTKRQTLSAKRAVGYVKTIAEAIHHAHERGILHRDLKPSNVVIGPDDQPRITDFGLARRLDGDSSLTLSGQVLGSPNFMPPEQAASHRGQTGRGSDVYGLGAILYYLLAGRPPFQGDDITATLDQVLKCDPMPLRVLNPTVPPELETICLKCLEKEPAKRYLTAQEVADELDRFLNDQPILTRSVGTIFNSTLWGNSEFMHGYLGQVDETIPERGYLFHVVCSFLRHFVRSKSPRICDLGCGDGALAEQILNVLPGASLTLVDAAPAMLEAARRRLGEGSHLRFVRSTFDAVTDRQMALDPQEGIVSSFAMHLLSQAERAALFFRLKETLVTGGWFLNVDTVYPDEPAFTEWQYELWREWILETEKRQPRPDSLKDVPGEARRNPDRKLTRLSSQLNALRRAGFEDVDCLYRNGIFVVYCGRKPLTDTSQTHTRDPGGDMRPTSCLNKILRMGLIGDYHPEVTAHRAIIRSLELAIAGFDGWQVDCQWLPTDALEQFDLNRLSSFDGLWCVPASPYVSMDGALKAIQFAREHGVPFLGTCAGFQHVLIEYARNVLGLADADHEETRPDAACTLVCRLPSPLVETDGCVLLQEGSRLRHIYGRDSSTEVYHCNFGLNPGYEARLADRRLRVCARNPTGGVHAVELPEHPFFVATLFQPERSGLRDEVHPLISAFVRAGTHLHGG